MLTFGRFSLAFVCLMTVTIILTSARVLPPKRFATFWHVNYTRPDFNLGPIVANWRAGISKVNPDELGSYFQGDIMLSEKPPTLTRNGVDYAQYQWTGGVVPYVIDSAIGSTQLAVINQAINTIQTQTCVKFIPRTTETDYVKVQNQNSGCWSYVGRKGGMQEINLQTNGCHIVGIAIHEFMHALGFFHEHTRDDRDNYVLIQWQNIDPTKKSNFDIWSGRKATYGVGYDYGSILHYSASAFSSNGQPTIVTVVPNSPIGQRTAMSTGDVTRIRGMYNCTA